MKEKKQAIKFFALLLVCMLLGMVTGRMGSHFQPLVEKINLTEFYNVFVFQTIHMEHLLFLMSFL